MKKALYAAAIASLLAAPVAAQQQQQCGPRWDTITILAEKYGEKRQSVALGANGSMVEVFASASGSWTITVTGAIGVTCIVAYGQSYERIETPPDGDPT